MTFQLSPDLAFVVLLYPEILDIKPEDLRAKFQQGVANLAAVCLSVGYPTIASAPHSIANGFKNLLAIAATTEVEFKEATTIKEFIKDPSKFAAAAAASAKKSHNHAPHHKSFIFIVYIGPSAWLKVQIIVAV
ncbi:hypothetical protein KR222_011797 [Zaprionus bogoriensis]|nr:hypothetical protein KR222_011797 [Zaprionus bogoriensis]